METPFDIYLVTAPGLETYLADEARAAGFAVGATEPGGVALRGGWAEVRRANVVLRGASRVLVRIAAFRALHLAQLDKRARKVAWGEVLRRDVPVRVEAAVRKSRIYHAGAARDRVARAIAEGFGAPVTGDAALRVLLRIEDDLATLSVDTSGEALHKRGFKEAVGKAPLRETMAALLLRAAGYDGVEPVLDPMCGSGTFPIEAAEIAAGLRPGRARTFAFESLATHDPEALAALRGPLEAADSAPRAFGSDRDAGAIRGAQENAGRAGVGALCRFETRAVSDAQRPEGPPGLVIVNPPYGGRIGSRQALFALHGAFGKTMQARFAGWRVGVVTNDAGLAKATGLDLAAATGPVAHGGLKVRLWCARVPG